MTPSNIWLRTLSTPVSTIGVSQLREPRLSAYWKSWARASSRNFHAQSNVIYNCRKGALLESALQQKVQCAQCTSRKLIHTSTHDSRPRLYFPKSSVSTHHFRYGENSKGVCVHGRRYLLNPSLAAFLTPPAVFLGLMTALWFYKCCMMVIFQNKIIYMPSVPPFSRQEEISSYENETKPVVWKQETIQSLDGTRLALCVGTLQSSSSSSSSAAQSTMDKQRTGRHLYVVYFQGNASSLPPRLPMLTGALKAICSEAAPVTCTLIALSYRGFWKSSGRASQPGIEKDAASTIDWVQHLRARDSDPSQLVIWGQSIGAGVATRATASFLAQKQQTSPEIDGIVLETPFTSIKSMLQELYPQKWLPYRYLWPFLRNWWDSPVALREIKDRNGPRDLLILSAGKDEVVPPDHGSQLSKISSELGFNVQYKSISGAYHHEVMAKGEGKTALAKFLSNMLKEKKS